MRIFDCRKSLFRIHSRVLGVVLVITVLDASPVLGGGQAVAANSAAVVVTYPAPSGEKLSDDYEVTAAGKDVAVYRARVLDPPFAGKQWDFGGPYSFANFDMAGHVTIRIT